MVPFFFSIQAHGKQKHIIISLFIWHHMLSLELKDFEINKKTPAADQQYAPLLEVTV